MPYFNGAKIMPVPEVEPENDELNAIVDGEKEFKAGKYTDWSMLNAKGPRMFKVDLNKKAVDLKSMDKKRFAVLSESSLKKDRFF